MLEKYPDDNTMFAVDCTNLLSAGETIVGTPVLTYAPSGSEALVFSSIAVNTSVVNFPDGTTAAVGKVVQVRIGGGSAQGSNSARLYSVLAKITTNLGNTMTAKAPLQVLPIGP